MYHTYCIAGDGVLGLAVLRSQHLIGEVNKGLWAPVMHMLVGCVVRHYMWNGSRSMKLNERSAEKRPLPLPMLLGVSYHSPSPNAVLQMLKHRCSAPFSISPSYLSPCSLSHLSHSFSVQQEHHSAAPSPAVVAAGAA